MGHGNSPCQGKNPTFHQNCISSSYGTSTHSVLFWTLLSKNLAAMKCILPSITAQRVAVLTDVFVLWPRLSSQMLRYCLISVYNSFLQHYCLLLPFDATASALLTALLKLTMGGLGRLHRWVGWWVGFSVL